MTDTNMAFQSPYQSTQPKSILKRQPNENKIHKPFFFAGNEKIITSRHGSLDHISDPIISSLDLPFSLVEKFHNDRLKPSSVQIKTKLNNLNNPKRKRRVAPDMYILHSTEINKEIMKFLLKSTEDFLEEFKRKMGCLYFNDRDLMTIHKTKLINELKEYLEYYEEESCYHKIKIGGHSNYSKEIGVGLSEPNMLDIKNLRYVNHKEKIIHAKSSASIAKAGLNEPTIYGSLPSRSYLDSFKTKELESNFPKINNVIKSTPPKKSVISAVRTNKKIVRFADSFGFDLEKVKIITNNSFSEMFTPYDFSEAEGQNNDEQTVMVNNNTDNKIFLVLLPCFSLRKYDGANIQLENYVYDHENKMIRCMVRVKNISFQKRIFSRVTLNQWKSYYDLNAVYIKSENQKLNNQSDLPYSNFSFDYFGLCLIIPDRDKEVNINSNKNLEKNSPMKDEATTRIEFAMAYECSDHETFWDNNLNQNYKFQCFYNRG